MKHDLPEAWLGATPLVPSTMCNHSTDDLPSIADLPPLLPPKGTWFDHAVDFREPAGDIITRQALAEIEAVEARKRRRRAVDERNHYTLVRKALANGFRCHFYRQPALVSYARRSARYKDSPKWLNGDAIGHTIDLLAQAGLVSTSTGEWGGDKGKGTASTYSLLDKACDIAHGCGVTLASLTIRLPAERLVRLRERNSKTPFMCFDQTDDTRRWTDLLESFNSYLVQQDIDLLISDEEKADLVRHWNRKSKKERPFFIQPEMIQTDLYRQFNNGSFYEGGRLYGGFWMNLPKEFRKRITINGKSTVELDFSGCAIRMLYHERGINYQDDPYWLETIALYEKETGLKDAYFRDAIKGLVQALINDQSGGKPELIQLPGSLSFRPRFKRAEVRKMIEEKHVSIADTFGTGAGLRLQRKDSDLAMDIITKLKEKGVAALPVHDSFLTTDDNKIILYDQMNKSYYNMFGYYPLIK